MTENRYVFQVQNSVTKKWITIYEGNLDMAEKEFVKSTTDPHNIKYGHKYRVMEMSHICSN